MSQVSNFDISSTELNKSLIKNMTKRLELIDSYLKEFDAIIEDIQDNKIILNQSAFYARGGGQPSDFGEIKTTDNKLVKVISAEKNEDKVLLSVEPINILKKGDKVKGIIDWTRRYKLMRMHTAIHLLHSVIYDSLKAMITGNEIDVDKTRFDLDYEISKERIIRYIKKANELIKKGALVKNYLLPKDEALKIPGIVKLGIAFPPDVKELRIVEIENIDIEADGGTHVKNITEIGEIIFLKLDNKGKGRKRIYFTIG